MRTANAAPIWQARVALASIVDRGDASTKDDAIRQAGADIELEVETLRRIITDLRPSMLDDPGLQPAIETPLDRGRDAGLEIQREVTLPAAGELGTELETTIYRIVQEALTNVVTWAEPLRLLRLHGKANEESTVLRTSTKVVHGNDLPPCVERPTSIGVP